MIGYTLARVITAICDVYSAILFIYVLMSWIPRTGGGVISDIYEGLGRICEPWLGLFRRFIPPVGNIDFSPIIAIIVLELIVRLIVNLLV
jgi:YggT family protein